MADLNYDRIVSVNAEGDKNTTLQIGVYMGFASLTVFSNRSLAAKFQLPRPFQVLFKQKLQKALTYKPGEKDSINFTKFDMETKKQVAQGSLFIGRDDKALFYLGVQATGHPPMKFLLRSPLSFDTSTPMSEVERSELAVHTLIEQLTIDIPLGMANTSFKRENTGGGGQRSGAGGGSSDNIF